MMDWGGSGSWAWWWMLPMMVFMTMLIAAVVWAFITATRSGRTSFPRDHTAEDVLHERFARGEIEADEYRERLETLRHGSRTNH
jgi:putative membrane protein